MAQILSQTAPSNTKPPVTTKEIWALTWPQALMMLLQFLVGFTDVVVAGRINPQVQAAFGIITQCQFFLLIIGMALSNGGLAAMSQALGARLHTRATRYVGLLLFISIGFCIITMSTAYFFRGSIFSLLKVPTELRALTDELWVLLLWVIPANYITMMSISVFRSRKNVMVPLVCGFIVCFLNTIGDFGFGLGYFGLPNYGAKGLVFATVISLSAGAIFNFFVMVRRGYISTKSFAPLRWQKKALPYILKVALPAGGNQFLWQLGYLVLFLITSTLPFGKVDALAGLTAGMRIEAILFLPGLAFSFTGSVLVGHCLGAGDKAEARRVGLRVAIAGALCMSIVAAFLYPWIGEIVAFVAPDERVQAVAKSYMLFNLVATPFTITSMVMTGIMTGAGATLYPMIVNSCATWLVRLPIAWYIGHIIWQSASGIFVAMLISQAVQAVSFWFVFIRCDWYRFASTSKRFTRDK